MAERALIVEPDPRWVAILEDNLLSAGYGVATVRSGSAALAEARRQRPDVLITELEVPETSGLELCRSLRADASSASMPILIVSARSDASDRIAALEAGADDYLGKPFSSRELVLRVRALLRHAQQSSPQNLHLQVGRLAIDALHHRVFVDGAEVLLTRVEFRLVLYLASQPGRVRSRNELLEHVWGLDGDSSSRTLDTHVKRLREKLGDARDQVQTIARVGYRLRESP